jgi:uncharacterized Ntn-hydrolase superfamily protein
VQSHWFSVGPIVPWAQAGVGAVATQANVELAYGPHGLDLMRGGLDAHQALAQLVAQDESAATRQVAIVDAHGNAAAHTGESCIPVAGHLIEDGVSCQANLMSNELVVPAMLEGFRSGPDPLASRLLAALDAAELAGGDVRGRQSAAILVVPAGGDPWETVVALRVEDHPQPLQELRRLARLNDAYTVAGEGDRRAGEGDHDAAARLYQRASALAPESDELRFWAGLGAVQADDLEVGLAQVRAAIDVNPGWRLLLTRLPAEVAPAARSVLEQLDAQN